MKVYGQSSGTRIELAPDEAVNLAAKILRIGDWGKDPVSITIDAVGEVWCSDGEMIS